MTNLNDTPDTPNTLHFDGTPVRIETVDGLTYYFLDDICSALGWSAFEARQATCRSFPPFGKLTLENVYDDCGPDRVTVLSPTGVFYFTNLVDAGRGQKITAWAKREARRLSPNHPKSDPAMFLKLVWGDKMPPRPYKFSGWRSEWYDLKDAHENAIFHGGDLEALKAGDQDYPAAQAMAEANAARERLFVSFAARQQGAN
jgi:hypothetical protein